MGICLCVNDETFRMSYTSFHEFRIELALRIGIDLLSMEGFCRKHPVDQGFIKPGFRQWSDVNSPLVPLLKASDSEGQFSVDEIENMHAALLNVLAADACA